MIDIIPLVNGKAIEHADISIVILNAPVIEVVAVDYEDKQEMSNKFSSGRFPTSRGYGKYEAQCRLTLTANEVESITNAAPNRRLQDIPEFNITVAYVDASYVSIRHTIRNCRFMGNNRKSKTGDQSIDVELDIITSHIDW